MIDKIELLNSEGPILVAKKVLIYELEFKESKEKISLDEYTFDRFIKGDMIIQTNDGKTWNYQSFSQGMKPSEEKLNEFLKK